MRCSGSMIDGGNRIERKSCTRRESWPKIWASSDGLHTTSFTTSRMGNTSCSNLAAFGSKLVSRSDIASCREWPIIVLHYSISCLQDTDYAQVDQIARLIAVLHKASETDEEILAG